MAVDLTLVPWDRLAKLAPPGTNTPELQAAADRHGLRADLYAAAADLWEDAANLIDLSPDTTGGSASGVINKVSQDGITVEYASDALAGNNLTSRIAQHGQYMAMVRRYRARSKPDTPMTHETTYDPWRNRHFPPEDPEIIVIVDGV